MTALSANANPLRKGPDGIIVDVPVAASSTIYKGAMVNYDADGYLIPAADTASTTFAGVALEYQDNSSGSDGDLYCRVDRSGSYEFVKASAAQTDVGLLAYVEDDQTVATSSTQSIIAGKIVEYIDSTHVRVDIEDRVA